MYDLDKEMINLERVISRATAYLKSSQLDSGEFPVYKARDAEFTIECEPDSSVFPTALIAHSLTHVDSVESDTMRKKATQFLKTQMLKPGVWRYWTKEHQYHNFIPPDIDDTVCASSALQEQNIAFPDNTNLILANSNEKGLLYTWLAPRWKIKFNPALWSVVLKQAINPAKLYYFWKLNESSPDDIDSVVNANALFYLGKTENTEPIIKYLCDLVKEKKEESSDKWHLSQFNLYYSISKCVYADIESFNSIRDLIVSNTLDSLNKDGKNNPNILETALGISTLLNFGENIDIIEKNINAIANQQLENGGWKKIPHYYGGPKKYWGWGSEALTTGFCLEALYRYHQQTS